MQPYFSHTKRKLRQIKEFNPDIHGIEYIQKAPPILETVRHILDEGKYGEIANIGRKYVKNNDWEAITYKFERAMNDLL